MSKKENGGPAFPVPNLQSYEDFNGMALRDYFAAKAMHAELITASISDANCEALIEAAAKAGMTIEQRIAFNSYQMADAMLEARK